MAKINCTTASLISPSGSYKFKKTEKGKLIIMADMKKDEEKTSCLHDINCNFYPSDLVTRRGRKAMAIKMSVTLSLLLLAIIIQTGSLYLISVQEIANVDLLSDDIALCSSYAKIIEKLQHERWSTLQILFYHTQFVSSSGIPMQNDSIKTLLTNTTTITNNTLTIQLMQVRNQTDQQFQQSIRFTNKSLNDQFQRRKDELYRQLVIYRLQVDSNLSLQNTSDLLELATASHYHRLIQLIFDWLIESNYHSKEDLLWQELVANQWLIHALDKLELVRYYGQLMWYNYTLPPSYQIRFMQAYYEQQLYLKRAQVLSSYIHRYCDLYLPYNCTIINQFHLTQLQLYNKYTTRVEYHGGQVIWFSYQASYQHYLASLQFHLNSYLATRLKRVKLLAQVSQTTAIVLLILVLVISPFSFLLVAKFIRRIQKYVAKLVIKSDDLEYEKSRTDDLLYQLLPPSVAEQLKLGRAVHAESFDDATIYFSDVVGFTNICHSSTAIQVVYMLNALYTLFDRKIDNHDVYKIETIGDAYMVVSGVPKRTGGRFHAKEIANMALDIRAEIENIKVPHMEGRQIKLRIGIHTGPCAAGVVGIKMPRYCLFGDTVTLASKMESNSQPSKIHISQNTYEALLEIGGFLTEYRCEIHVQGIGMIKTHWLLSNKVDIVETAS